MQSEGTAHRPPVVLNAESYSLFSNNCNNFADELAQLLCGRGIPEHITGGGGGTAGRRGRPCCCAPVALPCGAALARLSAARPDCAASAPCKTAWQTCPSKLERSFTSAACPSHHLSPLAGLPAEVLSTPFGQMIQPMLAGLEDQMRSMRAQAYRPHIEAAAAAALAAPPAPSTSVAPPAEAAAEVAPAAEPAVPSSGAAVAAAAAEEEGAGLRCAEVEIEAAVAAGMMQEAEQALGSLELQPAAGQPAEAPPAAAATAAAASEAAAGGKLAPELAVEAEFKRLMAAGMPEHEAQALSLEAVAAAAGAATDNPVQHSQGHV